VERLKTKIHCQAKRLVFFWPENAWLAVQLNPVAWKFGKPPLPPRVVFFQNPKPGFLFFFFPDQPPFPPPKSPPAPHPPRDLNHKKMFFQKTWPHSMKKKPPAPPPVCATPSGSSRGPAGPPGAAHEKALGGAPGFGLGSCLFPRPPPPKPPVPPPPVTPGALFVPPFFPAGVFQPSFLSPRKKTPPPTPHITQGDPNPQRRIFQNFSFCPVYPPPIAPPG